MAAAIVRSATASARSVTARLSASVFRSPVETGSSVIPPHCSPFGNVDGRSLSTFSEKTRRFRFQRTIDLKRSTSATGIVERIEYDPNRNSRIALVRWEGGSLQRKRNAAEELALPEKKLDSTSAVASGKFAFSSLPGMVDERNVAYFSNGGEKQTMKCNFVMVGVPTRISSSLKNEGVRSTKTSAKDVIASAFSSKAKGENADVSVGSPRIVVAGSRPAFFVLGETEVGGKDTFALGEVQRWKKDSTRWAHRIKRKGAVSWQSLMRQESRPGPKVPKTKNDGTKAKNGKNGDDRVPVTYIIASHQLRKGNLVMNWSESSASRAAHHAYTY